MNAPRRIPSYGLYGEGQLFPELLHCETFVDRAAENDWVIAPHRHPHLHQLFLLRKGQAHMAIEATQVQLAEGQIVSMPPWTVHGFTFSQGAEGFVLSLPISEFPELFATPPLTDRYRQWQIARCTPELDGLFDTLHSAFTQTPFARVALLRAVSLHLGVRLAEGLRASDDDLTRPRGHPLMSRFETLVRRHFREHWTVGQYAETLGVSAPHLSRVSRDTHGQPASRFIETVVFKEACNLLAYTRRSVADVGFALGFDDPAYFSRAFRKHTGLTPGAYRRVTAGTQT